MLTLLKERNIIVAITSINQLVQAQVFEGQIRRKIYMLKIFVF